MTMRLQKHNESYIILIFHSLFSNENTTFVNVQELSGMVNRYIDFEAYERVAEPSRSVKAIPGQQPYLSSNICVLLVSR